MSGKFKIYCLKDPITYEIRYIGYTSTSLTQRLRSHISDRNKKSISHKINWIRSIVDKGMKPIIEQLDARNTLDEILSLEIEYISKYENLTNSTSGGETNKIYCESVRRRISESLKGKMVGCKNPMYGKKRPDLSKRNKIINQSSVDKTTARLKEKYNTPEYKIILMDAQKTNITVSALVDGVVVGVFSSKREMADKLNLDRKSINSVLRGEYSQHKGYTFTLN